MIIRGILDKSLSKQTCIRGFARIKELARVSKANPDYQRELLDRQKKVISNFLTEENYLFFPEVILSVKLKYDLTKKGAAKEASPLTLIDSKKPFSSNVDSLRIRPSEKKYSKTFDTSGRKEIKIVELEFDEGELLKLIDENKHPFHRIDGNHRLTAAEQITDDDFRIKLMDIPFCIVLFEEITKEVFDEGEKKLIPFTDKSYEKFERVVFFNINSKSEPLTLEQNLKVIIDKDSPFLDEEIEKIFPKVGLKIRELTNKVKPDYFQGINHLLKDNFRNLSKSIFECLDDEENSTIVTKVFESLKTIEQLYLSEEKLKTNTSEGLFTAFLYYNIKDKVKFNFFKEWVLTNQIFEIEEAKYETLIQIFDKVSDQTIKIFVAMPYFSSSEVETYNQAYDRVLQKVKEKSPGIKIDLYKIMQHKGRTYNINNKMIEQINESNLFVADISKANVNVAFELGYARSAKKPTIMIKRESDTSKTPFDYEQDMCHSYNHVAIHTLEEIVFNNIKEELLKRGFIFTN